MGNGGFPPGPRRGAWESPEAGQRAGHRTLRAERGALAAGNDTPWLRAWVAVGGDTEVKTPVAGVI